MLGLFRLEEWWTHHNTNHIVESSLKCQEKRFVIWPHTQWFSFEFNFTLPMLQWTIHIQIPPTGSWVPYYAVPLWLLHVPVPLRVLWGYSAATVYTVISQSFVTVALEYPHSALDSTTTGGIWMCKSMLYYCLTLLPFLADNKVSIQRS